jgi:hypothetical protein
MFLVQSFFQVRFLSLARARMAEAVVKNLAILVAARQWWIWPSTSNNPLQQHHRRLSVKDRSKDWWDQHNHPNFPNDEFWGHVQHDLRQA